MMISSDSFATSTKPVSPFLRLVGTLWVCGYVVYFTALFIPAPAWTRTLIAAASRYVPALDTPRLVGLATKSDGFPAQIVMLYAAISALIIIVWPITWLRRDSRVMRALCSDPEIQEKRSNNSLPTYLVASFSFSVLMVSFYFYFVFFWEPEKNFLERPEDYWRVIKLYSTNILAISFQLAGAICMSSVFAGVWLTNYVICFPSRCISEEC